MAVARNSVRSSPSGDCSTFLAHKIKFWPTQQIIFPPSFELCPDSAKITHSTRKHLLIILFAFNISNLFITFTIRECSHLLVFVSLSKKETNFRKKCLKVSLFFLKRSLIFLARSTHAHVCVILIGSPGWWHHSTIWVIIYIELWWTGLLFAACQDINTPRTVGPVEYVP